MKIFSTLSDDHKERAIHMAEHIVLDNLLEQGYDEKPEGPEEKETFDKVQEALTYVKELERGEQVEYLFDHPIVGDIIMEKAYNVASTAFYIENDEIAFHLSEIDSHFGDDEEELTDEDIIEDTTTEIQMSKKDSKMLN